MSSTGVSWLGGGRGGGCDLCLRSCSIGWTGEETAQFVDYIHPLCSPEGFTESPGVWLDIEIKLVLTAQGNVCKEYGTTHKELASPHTCICNMHV